MQDSPQHKQIKTTFLLTAKQQLTRYFLPVLLLAGCASEPAPTQIMLSAEAAITHAEQLQVAEYASVELVEAREKMTAARKAITEKKMMEATRLAEQAELDANLSAARASAVKAKLVNDEMAKSTNTLKQEMQRNSGAK